MDSDKMMNSGTGVEISGPAGGDAGRHDFDTFFQDDVKPWRVLGQRLITGVYLCNPTALITGGYGDLERRSQLDQCGPGVRELPLNFELLEGNGQWNTRRSGVHNIRPRIRSEDEKISNERAGLCWRTDDGDSGELRMVTTLPSPSLAVATPRSRR